MNTIYSFSGDYACLSNFQRADVRYKDVLYYYSENAYQAQKPGVGLAYLEFADPSLTPGQAKRLGKKLRLRPDWDAVKFEIMEEIVRAKFLQNPDLAKILLGTKDALLVEGNTWGDKIWGMVKVGSVWVGANHLGLILMKIREELKS